VTELAREEDASVGEVRYSASHDGFDIDITFSAMLSARRLDRANVAVRAPLDTFPAFDGSVAVSLFAGRLNAPIATTLPRLVNSLGDERVPKMILGAPFHTGRLLACLAYVRAQGDCVVDVLSIPWHPRQPASAIHVRGEDWRVVLMSMMPTCEVTGAVRL
jgi:hypothetical protein